MQSLFGTDLSTAQKVIVASLVILVLLVLLGLFVRRIQGGRLRMKGQGGGRARQPRLGVVDTHDLDRQRQLILIRRDNVEHLIMIGGASDVVVETNIMRSGARAAPPSPVDLAMPDRPPAFDALPVQQEPMRSEPLRPDMATASVAIAQPAPAAQQPTPNPATPAKPAREIDMVALAGAIAVPAGAAAGLATRQEQPAPAQAAPVQPPRFTRDHAPSPTASPVELDDMTRQLDEALKRPFSAVRSANNPGEPAQPPEPAPAAKAVQPSQAAPVVKQEPAIPDALPTPTPPAPPVTIGKPVPLPADVEAELELALGLKPSRMTPASMTPAPIEDLPVVVAPSRPEPIITPAPPAQPAEGDLSVVDTEPNVDMTAAPSAMPEPKVATALASDPEPTVGADAKASDQAPEPEQPTQKPAAIDPFSVDAIEAEFARLLGRDPKARS